MATVRGKLRLFGRMVLDPKSIGHNDYGSFHTPPGIADTSEHTTVNLAADACGRSSGALSPAAARPVADMTASDLAYQRQPLLPVAHSRQSSESWSGSNDNPNEYYDDVEHGHSHERKGGDHIGNGVIKIDVPVPLREEPRFPKEKWKTFIAFLFLVVNFILTTCSLALTHERVPDRATYGPLPDIVLSNIGAMDWALDVSEVLIMISTNTTALVLIFHKHRFIIMRRVFMMLSLLYFMRSVTMFVTVLPVASTTYYCSPKLNSTSGLVVAKRVWQLLSGFGLSINGKHTFCGDYIYSGHTVILVMAYLIIAEYSPKRCFPLHWLSFAMSTTGVIMVLLAHGHYTVDILIAYYVTTTLFWTYHTLANNGNLKQSSSSNFLSRCWWFPLFCYFEKNVDGPVPRQYEWPLPWPRRCVRKSRCRES